MLISILHLVRQALSALICRRLAAFRRRAEPLRCRAFRRLSFGQNPLVKNIVSEGHWAVGHTAKGFSPSRPNAQNHPIFPCRTIRAILLALTIPSLFTSLSVRADNIIPAKTPATQPYLPPSSLLDLSDKLDNNIAKHGFVTVGNDGHFHYEDGTRARFWGINVSSTRLNIPNAQIEQVVSNFQQAGLNMVRLEAVDNRNCLLGSVDAPDSQHFDLAYLDRLDYWMDCLRRHGMRYYLDLLDFRTFKAGDGVLNAAQMARGARPYALFDRYLIQLQKEYASQLLLHKNRYSGVMPIDDPALALVEICNEHGFFLYGEKLEQMVEPYNSDLRGRWSQWLKARYQTRDQLAARWGQTNGVNVLRDDEDPDHNNVDLPILTGAFSPLLQGVADIRRAPTRMRDGIEFLYQTQRAYFKEMRSHLRAIGLRCPVTAVVSNGMIPDVASVAQECDFTSENWYGESVNGDPRTPGLNYYSNRNTLRDDSPGGFAPFTAALRWQNKPVVVREWATTWPNQYRAASVPEALAYASLQDFDAVLLFGYQTNRAPNGAEADMLNDFAVQMDPTTWGLYALAGQAFLNQAIRPAAHQVTFAYTPDRVFNWPNNAGELYRAAWSVRVNNALVAKTNAGSLVPTNAQSDRRALINLLNTLRGNGVPVSSASVSGHIWRSDTGQIVCNAGQGRLEINAPTLRVVSGEFAPGQIYSVGNLRFSTQSPFGTLFALSLDGLPIERSRHLIVKMVTRADNTGQVLEKAPPGYINTWVLRNPGAPPVVTFGRSATLPTRVWLESAGEEKEKRRKEEKKKTAGNQNPVTSQSKITNRKSSIENRQSKITKQLLSLWMIDGTWELEMQEGRATLACDTPGINGLAQGRMFTTATQAVEMAGLSGLPLFTPGQIRPAAPVKIASLKMPAPMPKAKTPLRAALASRSAAPRTRPVKSPHR